MIPLSTISMFIRAIGAFAAFAPPQRADRIVLYTNKAANLVDLAANGHAALEQARQKLESDAKTLQQWVDAGYEPTDEDFDSLEGRIDELHDRYQAARAPTSGE